MKTYRLTKTAVKNGKFLYEVKDENNNTISKRTSAREYVACTIDGKYYFGRRDLIGKGEHGRCLNHAREALNYTVEQWDKDRENFRRELSRCIACERSIQRMSNRPAEWLEKYEADCRATLEQCYPVAEREEQVAKKRKMATDLYERLSEIAYLEA